MEFCKCKYGNCAAVCRQLKEREIFEYIFRKSKLDIYLCEHAAYEIQVMNGKTSIVLSDLEDVKKGRNGYYIIDPFTANFIYLDKNNTQIVCATEEWARTCKEKEPYVSIYEIHKKAT